MTRSWAVMVSIQDRSPLSRKHNYARTRENNDPFCRESWPYPKSLSMDFAGRLPLDSHSAPRSLSGQHPHVVVESAGTSTRHSYPKTEVMPDAPPRNREVAATRPCTGGARTPVLVHGQCDDSSRPDPRSVWRSDRYRHDLH